MTPPGAETNAVFEVRFKNTRKEFFRNVHGLRLHTGDFVVVESERGYDVGQISLSGIMASLQMKKKGVKVNPETLPKIYRKASEEDVEKLRELRSREPAMVKRARETVIELKMDMKLSDVEYQIDGTKAIFYYIADQRVDFRELIRLLARDFRIRVEMRQIGLRHEAGLVGGIGVCGRELCCATWLTDFKTVNTSAARYQNLALNPMKLSGLCGRLKCCLNFELESYQDVMRDFPKAERIKTEAGVAVLQKTDIFKRLMWFSYPHDTNWYPLKVEEVKRILEMNARGETPDSLANIVEAVAAAYQEESGTAAALDFVDVVGDHVPDYKEEKRKRGKARGGESRRPEARRGEQGPQRPERPPQGPPQPRGERQDQRPPRPERPPQGPPQPRGERGPRPERPPQGPPQPRGERGPRPDRPPQGPPPPRGERGPRPERPPQGPPPPRGERGPRPERPPQGPPPPRGERPDQRQPRPDRPPQGPPPPRSERPDDENRTGEGRNSRRRGRGRGRGPGEPGAGNPPPQS